MRMIEKFTKDEWIENGYIQSEYRNTENLHVPVHWHDYFEIEYIISGNGDYIIDGKKYDIIPGMIFFMSPINTHTVIARHLECINISFSENICDSEILSQINFMSMVTAYNLKNDDRSFIKTTALELADNINDKIYSRILLNSIVAKLNKILPSESELVNDFSVSKKAVLYIINNFKRSILLEDVAEYVNLTPQYFSMLFKKETGRGVKEYLDLLRFEYAKKLILFSDMTMQEIASESGFSCYENFMRRFKKRYGKSPGSFRKE